MSGPRGRGRGGRGRGPGGQNYFSQQQPDGDMAMDDTRGYTPRGGRGGGYRGQNFQNQQNYHQQSADHYQERDTDSFNNSRGRGRGGRGRGQPFQQQHHQTQQQPSDRDRARAKEETMGILEGFLSRRYDSNSKLLDLSNIILDEEVRKSGMFDDETTQKKFFPALMVVCDKMLPSRDQKIEAIESISLANNNVPNLNVIYELVKYLNHIKNLDLSGNSFASLGPLKPWKNRFKSLEHLIINPFPEPDWEEEITSWFPRLRILNGKQVRPDDTMQAEPTNAPPLPINNSAPILPMGSSSSGTPVNDAQQKQEEMIAFVQQATNLRRDFAIQCLEAGQWDLQRASDLFTQSRDTLPPEAFN
ncbi:hypothetical protein GQ44DRAFT_601946 [Phaeosphaeriaceae sp. PMI808]|nr:hypothetical protein GQ44DRAFT_601946 [Phaeosphaeriaceae sp. PMI808]